GDPRHGRDERDGHRAGRRGLRGGRDRRSRLDARRLRRRPRRRRPPLDRALRPSRARGAAGLPHPVRGPRGAAYRPLRWRGRVKRALVLAAATAAVAAAPLVVGTYHVLLMLPFMAYAVILLRLNLLFGYTGPVAFW